MIETTYFSDASHTTEVGYRVRLCTGRTYCHQWKSDKFYRGYVRTLLFVIQTKYMINRALIQILGTVLEKSGYVWHSGIILFGARGLKPSYAAMSMREFLHSPQPCPIRLIQNIGPPRCFGKP